MAADGAGIGALGPLGHAAIVHDMAAFWKQRNGLRLRVRDGRSGGGFGGDVVEIDHADDTGVRHLE
jgi:hypothetical protein